MISAFVNRLAALLARLCSGIAAALVLAVAGLLLTDVIARAFGRPLFGAQDLAEMAMLLMTFGAVALLDQRDAQIRVDLCKPMMRPSMIALGDRLTACLAAALWIALAYAIWNSAQLSGLLNLSSNILKLPKAPFQYVMAALVLVAALCNILRALAPKPSVSA